MSAAPVDPITLEVLRESFVSIVREMRVTLIRTAYSSILYEGEDFSCVLMDGQAQIVSMSKGEDHPLHIVPIGWSMKAVLDKFGSDIRPGDIFLHNDPYTGGTHLNDVAMIYPLFADDRLFVFPVVRAHWGDVGGMSPGSLSGGATEIFQEGVRIPPIRIVDAGQPNQAALDLLFHNMRGPRERKGDFDAMIGTCRKAAERIEGLARRYGAPLMRAAVAELMDRAELRMRRAIAALPDGAYAYEAHLESGRTRLEPLTVRARVTVAGEAITVDLTGTSPQTAAPTNVGPAMAPTGAFTIIKSFLDPGADVNSGAFRPLRVITPPGTIVNADPPAPCGGMVEVKYCVETAVMGALAQALDGRVAGDLKGGGNHCYVGGPDPRTGETFIFYEYPAGGTGGFEGGDGSNTVRAWTESDMTTLQPIEAVEQLYPVRIERTALREDSGGPGRWRGGLGLTREVRIQVAASRLSVLAEKAVLPPFGVCGGAAGATNRFWVRRDGQPIQPSALPGKVSGFPLEPGDVLVMDSSGGGGFGDPLERDPARVAADIAEGYATPAAAERDYGVIWREGRIDTAATEAKRAALRAARPRVRLTATSDLDAERGRRVRMDTHTAERLGVTTGAVVELVNPRGAPLRAWVDRLLTGEDRRAEVAPSALAMLGVPDGTEVTLRAVHSGVLGSIERTARRPMDRRAFRGGLATVLLVPPPAAAPQSAGPPLRVGVIAINPRSAPFLVAFEDRLRDLGWVDGKNMTIVFRIAKGYVASVARPGGNITGVWTLGREQGPKQLELMRELLPKVTRIAVLWEAYSADQVSAIEEAGASTPGVQIEKLEVRPPYDFERAFLALRHQRVGTVLVVSSPIFFRERARIAQLALKHRLPAGGALNGVDAGLLLGFGVDPSVS